MSTVEASEPDAKDKEVVVGTDGVAHSSAAGRTESGDGDAGNKPLPVDMADVADPPQIPPEANVMVLSADERSKLLESLCSLREQLELEMLRVVKTEVTLKKNTEGEKRLFPDFHVVCDTCREVKMCAEIDLSERQKKALVCVTCIMRLVSGNWFHGQNIAETIAICNDLIGRTSAAQVATNAKVPDSGRGLGSVASEGGEPPTPDDVSKSSKPGKGKDKDKKSSKLGSFVAAVSGKEGKEGKDKDLKDKDAKDKEGKDKEGKDKEGKDKDGKEKDGKDKDSKDSSGKGDSGQPHQAVATAATTTQSTPGETSASGEGSSTSAQGPSSPRAEDASKVPMGSVSTSGDRDTGNAQGTTGEKGGDDQSKSQSSTHLTKDSLSGPRLLLTQPTEDGLDQVSVESTEHEEKKEIAKLDKHHDELVRDMKLEQVIDKLFLRGVLTEDELKNLSMALESKGDHTGSHDLLVIIRNKPHDKIVLFFDLLLKEQPELKYLLDDQTQQQRPNSSQAASSPSPSKNGTDRQSVTLGPGQVSGVIHIPRASQVVNSNTWRILMNADWASKHSLWRGAEPVGILELALQLGVDRANRVGLIVEVRKGYDFRCWEKLGDQPSFEIYCKLYVKLQGKSKEEKLKTSPIKPVREPIFDDQLLTNVSKTLQADLRELKVQLWEYTGKLSRSVAVASATINLQLLQMEQQVVGQYPLFVPPPSKNNSAISSPFGSLRRSLNTPVVTRGNAESSADEADGDAPENGDSTIREEAGSEVKQVVAKND